MRVPAKSTPMVGNFPRCCALAAPEYLLRPAEAAAPRWTGFLPHLGRELSSVTHELAPPDHSITSSAATSKPGGTVRPSALAVLRLRVVSYLIGACTGRSAGLAPRRMRST